MAKSDQKERYYDSHILIVLRVMGGECGNVATSVIYMYISMPVKDKLPNFNVYDPPPHDEEVK